MVYSVAAPETPSPGDGQKPAYDTRELNSPLGCRIPGFIDSRAGPHGYGFGTFSPHFCGSGNLEEFSPSVRHRYGCSQPFVKPPDGMLSSVESQRRGRKRPCEENCIFRLCSLNLPLLLRTSASASDMCATCVMAFTPRVPSLGLASHAGLFIPMARLVSIAFTDLIFCQCQ